ncbi:hypothetical protein BKA83DRAFT_4486472 [Pisolithus microcarpus]|nr:hypothetical protein BKA83DRAFT_4486472 [Pisolithus microcarpus]
MPSFSKVCHASDKENFMDTLSGRPRHPSEKQKQLEYEQQELARHHDAKAQKTHEQIHCQQWAKEGSEKDTDEEDEVDHHSNSNDEDMRFTSQVVTMKLSEATNE